MSNLQANFRAIVSHHSELTDIAKELNKSILSITHGDQFVTAFICRILIAENKLQYLNAGHIPPLVSHNEDCFYLKKGTTILGVFNALPELEFGEMDIEPGMKLLVFTDGVNEVSDYRNKTFEALGIEKVLMSLPDGSASLINKALLESINRFKGDTEYKDDITILTVVFKG
jgi:sigma-B regulation protein RsbU (phosphoserine phosphatase)